MRRSNHVGVLVIALLAFLVPAAGSVSSAQAAPAVARSAAVSSAAPVARTAVPPVGHYTPRSGVRVNNPMGTTAEKRMILDHLIRSINSAKKYSKIRIATWNLRSRAIVNALINAHKRRVSVRLTMDYGNANPEKPNEGFNALKYALKDHNANRPRWMKSWARRCHSSCRGRTGISHTKLYLFSHVGTARNVVMFGSVNATDLAAYYQWNDLYTLTERPELFGHFEQVFKEMGMDTRPPTPYETFGSDRLKAYVFPYGGPEADPDVDPVLSELNRVRCDGATGGTGVNGHTSIRIAMTAQTDTRGLEIARRLKTMWNRGCDIKIIYAMYGDAVLGVLREASGRGPIPMAHFATDWNFDGFYDRYLHMKVMTVSGVYAGNTAATMTWNGSANWTNVALVSDEAGMRITLPAVQRKYATWIDTLFANPPPPAVDDGTGGVDRVAGRKSVAPTVKDPYALVEVD